jgi:hypothetical protein
MPAAWARGSIRWLVTSFLSNGYQLQFPHGEAMVPQGNQTGYPYSPFAPLASEEVLSPQCS